MITPIVIYEREIILEKLNIRNIMTLTIVKSVFLKAALGASENKI